MKRSLAGCAVALMSLAAAVTIGCATPPSSAPKDLPANAPASATVAASPSVASSIIVNPGFESSKPGKQSDVEGWYMYQHAGERSYEFVLDPHVVHGGMRSLRITNIGSEPYGSIAQDVPGGTFAGKTVRYSGWLKTEDAGPDGAGLFISAEGGTKDANNFMADAQIRGTRDWQRYSITLSIPPQTRELRIGVTLQGKGSVWFDDAELEIVTAR